MIKSRLTGSGAFRVLHISKQKTLCGCSPPSASITYACRDFAGKSGVWGMEYSGSARSAATTAIGLLGSTDLSWLLDFNILSEREVSECAPRFWPWAQECLAGQWHLGCCGGPRGVREPPDRLSANIGPLILLMGLRDVGNANPTSGETAQVTDYSYKA